MLSSPRRYPLLAALLCLVLLVVRVGAAHIHLCFDGTESPASYHLFDDVPLHDTPSAVATHQDVDLALTGEHYSKPDKRLGDVSAVLLAVALVWLHFDSPRVFNMLYSVPPASSATGQLRPPLRGPPLHISL